MESITAQREAQVYLYLLRANWLFLLESKKKVAEPTSYIHDGEASDIDEHLRNSNYTVDNSDK